MRGIWFILGWLSVAIGTLGIITPILPTVPLLLLAAFCFAKSSEKAHHWLITHKVLGPPILDWQQHGAIRRRAKITASICIVTAFGVSLILDVAWWALLLQALVLLCVSTFIWTRPEV